MIGKGTGRLTEKSSGDLRSLAVTQNPVKNHQLTLARKLTRVLKNRGT